MPTELFSDYYRWTVNSGGTDAPTAGTAETLTVASATGAPPAATGVSQFRIVDAADTSAPPEIMTVTNVSGTTWTATRGAEGGAPWAHAAGWIAVPVLSAGAMGNLPPPSGTAGGDLNGTFPNPTVDGLQGRAVSATAPTANQVLEYVGSTWTPTSLPTSLPPSGTASGDLSGSYPGPTVARINGVAVSGTPASGYLLVASSATAAAWATPPASPPNGAASGDLSGTYPGPTVARVNGVAVSGTPASGYVLVASSATAAAWATPPASPPSGAASGDLSGTYPSPTVARVNGTTVPATPAVGQTLVATSTTAATWQTPPASPPNGAASGDLSGTYPGPTVAAINGVSVTNSPSTSYVLLATSPTAAAWSQQPNASYFVYTQTLSAPTVVSSPYTVPHGLNTLTPFVQVWDAITGLLVTTQVAVVNANTISISVAQNMPNNVNVVVMGSPTTPVPVNPGDMASKSYVDARTPNLPAPVTSGTTVQSFTDALGDVWVAKNGVNSGAWKRARDVLHARTYRSAAFSLTTTFTQLAFDTVAARAGGGTGDNYGMSDAIGFAVPVAGIYRVSWHVGPTATAGVNTMNMNVYIGGTIMSGGVAAASASNQYPTLDMQDLWYLTAGQTTRCQVSSGVAISLNTGTINAAFHSIEYVGTG